ncbi:MAG: hypothetical protein EB127_19295 [Alphaproteobacteria bacterium]|nr:hypothetical protein [Alphaproteobacteria bacterium]
MSSIKMPETKEEKTFSETLTRLITSGKVKKLTKEEADAFRAMKAKERELLKSIGTATVEKKEEEVKEVKEVKKEEVKEVKEVKEEKKEEVKKEEVKEEKKEAGKPRTPKREIPEYIKSLKVGDKITYGQSSHYMGDGGDSRDVGYSVTRSVIKVLPRNQYEVEGRYSDQTEKFGITPDGLWLKHLPYSYFKVYSINGTTPSKDLESKQAEYSIMKSRSIREKHAEKTCIDWRNSTSNELRNMIEQYFGARGKRMTNIGTAKKEKLIEIIEKYKIRE